MPEPNGITSRVHRRGSEEFARAAAFSDGIFAVAMTLLVAGIVVPRVANDELAGALADDVDDMFAFALSFLVIGFYWLAHHGFFGLLDFIEGGILRINLVYLATIAFLPFPTALIGRYDDAPVAVVLYAGSLAAASLLEAVMLRRARAVGAVSPPMPAAVYRHAMRASIAPGLVFLGSIPIAFAHPRLATLSWVLIFVVEKLLDRRRPAAYRAWELQTAEAARPGAEHQA